MLNPFKKPETGPEIKFLATPQLLNSIDKPCDAVKALPTWFKSLKPFRNSHPSSGTVKTCVPFLDASRMGYIIPLWCDVYVRASEGSLNVEFPEGFPQSTTLGRHDPEQIYGHPLMNKPYGDVPLKWINPWLIETTEGYSCLITSPLNHLETRFKILDGVVDTDTYYNQINFPFLWTAGDGEFLLKKGTPLAHVIPFKREEFKSSTGEIDAEKQGVSVAKIHTKLRHSYKTLFWHKRKGV